MKWLRNCRIRKLEERIVELEAYLKSLNNVFSKAGEINSYYINKMAKTSQLLALFEHRLSNLKKGSKWKHS